MAAYSSEIAFYSVGFVNDVNVNSMQMLAAQLNNYALQYELSFSLSFFEIIKLAEKRRCLQVLGNIRFNSLDIFSAFFKEEMCLFTLLSR